MGEERGHITGKVSARKLDVGWGGHKQTGTLQNHDHKADVTTDLYGQFRITIVVEAQLSTEVRRQLAAPTLGEWRGASLGCGGLHC